MKFIFYWNIFFVLSKKTDEKSGIPDYLRGRITFCGQDHLKGIRRAQDQAGTEEKYLVLPDFPKPLNAPITCSWRITSRTDTYLKITVKQLKMPCNGRNMLLITDGQSIKYFAICGIPYTALF